MKKIVSDTLVLVIITLVAGFLLGGVYIMSQQNRPLIKKSFLKKVLSLKNTSMTKRL